MADELKTILIKDLQEAESASDTDYIAIDNGTITKKISVGNYNKTANGTAKSYAESAKESADKAQRNADSVSSTVTEITNNITAAQSAAIQAEQSAEAAESATSNLQTYVNAAKESADNAKVSEESTKNVADKIADSNKIAQSYAVGGTNYRTGEDTDNARYYYSGAKTAEANAETYKSNAAASASAAATSEINAKTSETNAAKSAASASSSAESATASKTAAATSEQNASNSADYARTNATRAESYAIGGTSSRSGEDTDNAKYYAQQAKKSAELAAGSVTGVSSLNGKTGAVTINKSDIGLGNVDNTKDADKPVSTAVQTALDKKADKTLATASANGLMSAADKKAIDREFFRMLPKGGTYIPANADLNSVEYLKVGNYYNPLIVESRTIKNMPIGSAFIMYVLSPLSEGYDNESSGQWVYRLRIFVECTGSIYTQFVNSEATKGVFFYHPWSKFATDKSDVGLGSVANLDQSKAIKSITRSGTTFTATALDGTTTTFTQQAYGVATSSADGLMSKSDKAKLDGVADQASQLAKNTAQIETAGTATNAHSVGEYVMISNALYKVTASVAKGDTWTIGTNVTAANVGSEISSLKSDLANHSALHVLPLSDIADAQNGFDIQYCNVAIQGKIVLCWLSFAINNISIPQWKDFALAKLKSGYYPAEVKPNWAVGIVQEQTSGLTGTLQVVDNAIKINTHAVSFNSQGWCWGFVAYVLA